MSGDHVFAGSIAGLYDSILGPFMFEPFAREPAARLAGFEGELLEIAAGTGIVTRALDSTLGAAARITATDLNEPMLAVAAARLDSPRVAWRQADALALPFADREFDAAVCQFGVMFYADRRAGHAEAMRVLRPGGRYMLSVWDDLARNPVAEAVHETVGTLFPDDPPQFLARTPYGHHDTARLRADLAAAGFRDIVVEAVKLDSGAMTAGELARGFCQGTPLRGELEARDADGVEQGTAAVEQALRRRFGDGRFASPIQAHLLTAWR